MIFFDAHCDTILDLERNARSLAVESPKGHADLPRLQRAGVKFQVFALFVPQEYRPLRDWDKCLEMGRRFQEELQKCQGELTWIRSKKQLAEADLSGNSVHALLAVEGGSMIGESLERLEQLSALGVRSLTLVWNQQNAMACGVGDTKDTGLSPFGIRALEKMEDLGMAVDLAHMGQKGFRQALERARKPVLFSHGNARALTDHRRNLDDAAIRALAQNGGLMGICYFPAFVGLENDLSSVARHINYVCQLLGTADHLCLGSDFDGSANQPLVGGMADVTDLPKLVPELERLGYSRADLEKICWKNLYHYYGRILPEMEIERERVDGCGN